MRTSSISGTARHARRQRTASCSEELSRTVVLAWMCQAYLGKHQRDAVKTHSEELLRLSRYNHSVIERAHQLYEQRRELVPDLWMQCILRKYINPPKFCIRRRGATQDQ